MLWSQFSAIFANFRRKKWRFLKNQRYDQNFAYFSFVSSQKLQFFRNFFGENILKTITLFPGRTLPVPETEFSFKSRALEREKNAPRTELIF
jgi:hypothetical protein